MQAGYWKRWPPKNLFCWGFRFLPCSYTWCDPYKAAWWLFALEKVACTVPKHTSRRGHPNLTYGNLKSRAVLQNEYLCHQHRRTFWIGSFHLFSEHWFCSGGGFWLLSFLSQGWRCGQTLAAERWFYHVQVQLSEVITLKFWKVQQEMVM